MNFLLYFLLIHLLLFLPGYIIAIKLKILKDPLEVIVFGYIISITIFSLLAISYFFIGYDIIILKLVSFGLFGFSLLILIRERLYLKIQSTTPLIFLIIFSLTALLYVSLPFSKTLGIIPDPYPISGRHYKSFNVKILNLAQTPANDNSIPYRQAQFFVNRLDINKEPFISEWGVNFFFRTPLMGAVTAYFFEVGDEKLPNEYIWQADLIKYDNTYIKFQIIASILNSLFILPGFLLIKKLFNQKVAIFTLVFTFFNAYFLYNTFFSWPKLFIAFFILFSWYLLISKKSVFLIALISGLAYYAHDLTVLYVAGIGSFLLLSKRLKDLVKYSLVFAAIIFPWYVVSRLIYHQTSLFLYYPFFLKGIQPEPKTAVRDFFHTPVLQIIKIKLDYLIYLLTPYYQFVSSRIGFIKDLYLSTIFTLPGAIGLSLFLFSFFSVIKQFRRNWVEIVSFILIPVGSSVILIGNPKGINLAAMHYLEPIVLLLIGFGIFLLLKLNRVAIGSIFLAGLFQYFLVFFYNYNFGIEGWLGKSNLLSLFALGGIYVGLIIYFLIQLYPEFSKILRHKHLS